MEAWRKRLENGEDLLGPFLANARRTLDYLIEQGYTDPQRVAACGVSRGAFLAFHFAATDVRVQSAAGISPLTDLMALREFTGTTKPDAARKLSIVNLAPALAGRAIWLSIGNNDSRVDTDLAISFTRACVRATGERTKQHDPRVPVELIVAPAGGHRKIDQAHELLVAWLQKQWGMQ